MNNIQEVINPDGTISLVVVNIPDGPPEDEEETSTRIVDMVPDSYLKN